MTPRITAKASTMRDIKARIQMKIRVSRATGDQCTYLKAQVILSILEQMSYELINKITGVSQETIRIWVVKFIAEGMRFFKKNRKSPGRPPKLTKQKKSQLKRDILKGPRALGYLSASLGNDRRSKGTSDPKGLCENQQALCPQKFWIEGLRKS